MRDVPLLIGSNNQSAWTGSRGSGSCQWAVRRTRSGPCPLGFLLAPFCNQASSFLGDPIPGSSFDTGSFPTSYRVQKVTQILGSGTNFLLVTGTDTAVFQPGSSPSNKFLLELSSLGSRGSILLLLLPQSGLPLPQGSPGPLVGPDRSLPLLVCLLPGWIRGSSGILLATGSLLGLGSGLSSFLVRGSLPGLLLPLPGSPSSGIRIGSAGSGSSQAQGRPPVLRAGQFSFSASR